MNKLRKFGVPFLLCLTCCFFIYCKKKDNVVVLKGNLKGLNADKIYLYRCCNPFDKPIDSATITNNKFQFEYHPDSIFESYFARLRYHDLNANKLISIFVNNPYTSKPGKPQSMDAFYVEPGTTELTFDRSLKQFRISVGPQNEFLMHNSDLAFIGISHESVKHQADVATFKNLVKQNPDAYWALFSLANHRQSLTKADLQDIYQNFNDEVKNCYSGKYLKRYIDDMADTDGLQPNDLLADTTHQLVNLIDTTKKLNMLVFWASWCGPCNEEIPGLKKIAAEFKDKNFRMVSISVDIDTGRWNMMRRIRAMPWQQLIIQKDVRNKVIAQYNLQAIPQIYFVDNKRKLIKHINGNYDANVDIYRKTIIAVLNSPKN